MIKMAHNVIDWDFEQATADDFKVKIEMDIDNRVLMQIFNTTRQKLREDRGIDAAGNPDAFNFFDVDPRYLNFIKTTLNSKLKRIYDDVKKDGIIILNDKAAKGTFNRVDKSKWRFTFIVIGQFYKKL